MEGPGRWEGISTINNFSYGDDNQVTAWKAFDVGPGKSVPWSRLQGQPNIHYLVFHRGSCHVMILTNGIYPLFLISVPSKLPCLSYVFQLSPGDFVPCWERKPSAKATESQISSKRVDEEIAEDSGLFCCPVDGCIESYQRYSNLENHIMFGQCCLRPHRKYNLLDQSVLLYAEKLTVGDSAQPTLVVQAEQCKAVESLQKGWALKGSRKTARFTENQRKYLSDKFRIGQETSHKADPEQVDGKCGMRATKEASAHSRWTSF